MKYEISTILVLLSFIFGIASFATTTYGGDKKQANTGSVEIQKPEKDGKEDSKEPIRQIENLPKTIIGKQSVLNISKLSSKKSIVVSAEKKSKILDIPNANHVGVKDTKSYESKIIYRNGWNDPRVQYAYNISGGDMDFIKTIEAESKWDVNALGDGGKSFGLCQIHKGYNPTMQKAYRALKTDNEKVKMCYDQYKDWVKRGVIKTRLYGFNVRNKPQNKNSFTIY